jgi:hypothetical protein
MRTLDTILILYSIGITVLTVSLLFYRKAIERYKTYKNKRETLAMQRRNAANARLIKTVREEVKKYLEELRND